MCLNIILLISILCFDIFKIKEVSTTAVWILLLEMKDKISFDWWKKYRMMSQARYILHFEKHYKIGSGQGRRQKNFQGTNGKKAEN